MMSKGSNEMTIGQAIKELLKTYKLEDKMTEVKLINSWESVVGKMIANHTVDIKLKKRKLFVKMDSAAITNELTYAKTKMVKALNKEAGADILDEIIFN
ncbi:MAG: DUF721 domain-containing protein [Bacteroidetes bacterium]|nr:DUF721 domain-containing protein [Bacteroidota bacterium]